jgi:hypothetical protein
MSEFLRLARRGDGELGLQLIQDDGQCFELELPDFLRDKPVGRYSLDYDYLNSEPEDE